MNREEIDYWLRYFSNHNHGFMSEDGKKITLFKVFQELKELQYLLKIKNDYIKELEAYKYNMNRDYLRLEKENEEYKRLGFEHLNDKCNKLENQQKEFIKYLNSYIELLKDKPDLVEEGQKDILEEILSKYYEIIEK